MVYERKKVVKYKLDEDRGRVARVAVNNGYIYATT